ncbi:hypothetical protein AA11825_0272 [Acetobacter pomorum DSM 11825]|nr:hypothetical protein AA11825_0272 [Acetobacter pomorum DSM 11825]
MLYLSYMLLLCIMITLMPRLNLLLRPYVLHKQQNPQHFLALRTVL